MNTFRNLWLLLASLIMFACSTPSSNFGIYRQSDGLVGVHAPKDAKEEEAHGEALVECKKLGKQTARVVDTHATVNDRFPMTYLYLCQ
jgi:hypothetical protein